MNGDNIVNLSSFQFIEKPLIDLIAETSIWVNPSSISLQPIYPDVRRGMPQDRGRIIEGVRIDDNTYANRAIKKLFLVQPNSKTISFAIFGLVLPMMRDTTHYYLI